MIRVLIVDDSAVLRQSTRFVLESDPELTIIGEASNGAEALTLVDRLRPDVITMDIRMPKMDGLEAIRQIMAEHPTPIVVVTSIDLDREIGLSMQATRLGAVAVLNRPRGAIQAGYKAFAAKLIGQVKLMSAVKVIRRTRDGTGELSRADASLRPAAPVALGTTEVEPPSPALTPPAALGMACAGHPGTTRHPVDKTDIVAIGSSTGGPAALHQILSALPASFPAPIVVVQHISFGFVNGLAGWLNDACALRVKVAEPTEKVQPGQAYVAPDNHHLLVDRFGRLNLDQAEPVSGFRPSITALFQSVARAYGPAAMGVLLTGMGADGAEGMRALHLAGAITIAQDEASCVVFGMPKEAVALGAVKHVVALDKIAQAMTELCVV